MNSKIGTFISGLIAIVGSILIAIDPILLLASGIGVNPNTKHIFYFAIFVIIIVFITAVFSTYLSWNDYRIKKWLKVCFLLGGLISFIPVISFCILVLSEGKFLNLLDYDKLIFTTFFFCSFFASVLVFISGIGYLVS